MQGRVLQEIICVDCGKVVTAYNKTRQRCPECALIRRKETHKEWMESTKKPRQKKPKAVKMKPPMTIGEVIKAMEKYNKEHKTHYTYGQYVSLMEGGRLDGREESK